jgi:hypothetical protein
MPLGSKSAASVFHLQIVFDLVKCISLRTIIVNSKMETIIFNMRIVNKYSILPFQITTRFDLFKYIVFICYASRCTICLISSTCMHAMHLKKAKTKTIILNGGSSVEI